MADLEDLRGRMLGEFILRERIDEGGFGAVYRCEQPLLGREAVVKVLHQRLRRHDVELQRFTREAKLASRLDHPYAAHVYAFGIEENDGLLWIAMELVQGVTLNSWLKKRGPLPLEQLVPFFDRVAEVVQAAHERGIVHRDLKPSNVMVIERAGRLVPKLLDFGVAKLVDDVTLPAPLASPDDADVPHTQPGPDDPERTAVMRMRGATPPSPRGPHKLTRASAALGSPPYMSPEQWNDPKSVGPASDLYALGVIAYEALTGRRPFVAETLEEYGELHRTAPVPPLGGNFAPSLDRLFERALAKRPEDRWGSALELAAALRAEMEARMRAQVRIAARQWHDRGRSTGLLWRDDLLAELESWMDRSGMAAAALTDLEHAFVDASRQHESELRAATRRRASWMRRGIVALAAMVVAGVFGAFQLHALVKARMAEREALLAKQFAEKSITQAEVEQGRQALLHGESDEAVGHLGRAWQRGERSPAMAFMLARALQPRRSELARFKATSGRMWSAAFSPDGRRIVTTDDQCAQVWDAETNQLLFTLAHRDSVLRVVYSADGARIVTASGDGTIKIWDAATGAPLRELTHEREDGKPSRYFIVAMSPDGRVVAAIDTFGEVAHAWDAHTGAALAELRNDGSECPSLAFSADGLWLATSGGRDVRVFDTATWTQALTLDEPGARVRGLSFDPTGPRLATGTYEGAASIWEIPSGARLRHLREIGEPIDGVAFSRNGALVVTASRDGAEQVWNAGSGKLQSQFNHLGGKIHWVEFDPSSRLVLAAGASGAIVVSDAALGMPVTVLEGPPNVVREAHFDPSSRRVVGASEDGTARVWDATAPYRRWSSPPIADFCGVIASLEPDRRFLAVGCQDHRTRVWDTAHDLLLAELPSVTPVIGDFTSAFPAVSAAGDRAAIARGNTVEIYALPGGRLVRTITHPAAVNAVAFGPTGHDLVSGGIDGSLLVTRDDREPIALPLSPGGIDAAAILADGRVVAADARSRLRVHAPDRNVLLADLAAPTRVKSLRPSPDGDHLITVPSYKAKPAPAVLWDLEDYRPVAELRGHVGRVNAARFVREGREILTTGGDGTVRLWDGPTGQPLRVYRGSSRFMVDATLDPDGWLVVAGGGDGLLRFWEASSGHPLWTFPAHKSHLIGIHFEGSDVVTRGFSGDLARWRLPAPEKVITARGGLELAITNGEAPTMMVR